MKNIIGLAIGFAMILGGGYGVAHRDWGGAPFLVLGIALVAYLLWPRNHRSEGE